MNDQTKTRLFEFLQEEFWLLISLIILFIFFLVFPFVLNLSQPVIGLQIVLNGIVVSVLYAILAMGFSLIYGTAKQLKLSLGGYYVIAAYAMYFLLEAVKINVPVKSPILRITATKVNIDGFLFWAIALLPIIVSMIILLFMWTVFEKRAFFLVLISTIISGGGYILVKVLGGIIIEKDLGTLIEKNLLEVNITKLLERNLVDGFYISLAVILLSLAAWYLELPKREIAVGTAILGLIVPLMIIVDLTYEEFGINKLLEVVPLFGSLIGKLITLPVVYLALMVVAVMLTACLAMMSDRYLLEKVRKSHVNVMIVTFAVALFVQNFIQIIYYPHNGKRLLPFGPEDRTLHGIVPLNDIIVFFGARISFLRIISVIFSILLLFLLYAFIWFTKMGKALRAVSQDEEAAALAGVDIRKITAIVSGVGMGIIGFAAVLTSSFSATPQWSPYMGWWVLITCIAVVTLGGMGSLPGSIIAAFIIGFAETVVGSMTTIIPVLNVPFNNLSPVIPFAAILLVLIFKPEGLLGTKEELE
ncbi:MAG: branched-chain amino acid ABC transporter permease [Promethearchaeota archaeon]